METIELFIDADNIKDGVNALSFVESPATEENWVFLNSHKVDFKAIDEEKRIIIGYALIPDKEIYRKQGDQEFNIIFSKDTVAKACELYATRLKNNNTTLEHTDKTNGVSVIQSWIVEDVEMDKVNLYDLNPILGGWVVIMKIYNDEVWQDVKLKKYLGISIEGLFSDKQIEQSIEETEAEDLISKLKKILCQ